MKTKKIVLLGLLSSIALTIFMVEAQIPTLVPIPGVKLGLSNIVTVFTVFCWAVGKALLYYSFASSWALFSQATSAPSFIPVPVACAPFLLPSV